MTEEHGISFWEFVGGTEEDAKAFVAEAKEKGYDVEDPSYSTAETDGRVKGLPGLTEGEPFWSVHVYMDWECTSREVQGALDKIAERHYMDDWGSEPSSSFDHDDRDASRSAHL